MLDSKSQKNNETHAKSPYYINMTDETTAEAWLDSLQEMLEQNLIETGYISEATREFFNLMGYDDSANPSHGTVRDYVMALSDRLLVPSTTDDLDKLEQEYQKLRYTRRCLQFGRSARECLVDASKYGHVDVVNASLQIPESRLSVLDAVYKAIDNNHLDVVKALDPYIIVRNPEDSDEDYANAVDDVFNGILDNATLYGRLEILKHELAHASSYGYRNSLHGLFEYAVHSGSVSTLAYLVETYPEDAVEYFEDIVESAIEVGDAGMLAYLQKWPQSRPGELEPLSSADIIADAFRDGQKNVIDAFIDDVSADELSAMVRRSLEHDPEGVVTYLLSYLEQRGLITAVNPETIIDAGIKRRNVGIVEAALDIAERRGINFPLSHVRVWLVNAMR